MGRFISVDPIGAGNNWYAYCYDNPVNNIDPNGLEVYVGRSIAFSGFSCFGQTIIPTAYHTFVLVTDKPIGQASVKGSKVLEAGPDGDFGAMGSIFGSLKIHTDYNVPEDVLGNPNNYNLQEIPTPSQYSSWNDFANDIKSDYNYFNSLDFTSGYGFPEINSNSFTGSLLRENGSNWHPDYWTPGWDTNIDSSYFNDTSTKTSEDPYGFINDSYYDYSDY